MKKSDNLKQTVKRFLISAIPILTIGNMTNAGIPSSDQNLEQGKMTPSLAAAEFDETGSGIKGPYGGWGKKKESGFTLIESVVSMTLILLALFFISRVIVFSVRGNHKSEMRLRISQAIEACKNRFMSVPFDSIATPAICADDYPGLNIRRQIITISPSLKRVKLSVGFEQLTRHVYFYKSRYIKEVLK
ncbi:MAG: hypothetical protein GY765_44165 [bacterium]|nr:hypothetical protein [bacterium]